MVVCDAVGKTVWRLVFVEADAARLAKEEATKTSLECMMKVYSSIDLEGAEIILSSLDLEDRG
jgi:hypothetical protein